MRYLFIHSYPYKEMVGELNSVEYTQTSDLLLALKYQTEIEEMGKLEKFLETAKAGDYSQFYTNTYSFVLVVMA